MYKKINIHPLLFLIVVFTTTSFITCNDDENDLFDETKPDPYSPATSLDGMILRWSDEFNTDGAPAAEYWNFEKGFVRNQELQWYQSDNATCKDGALIITAKKERVRNTNYNPNATGNNAWKQTREYAEYTSASMTTSGKFEFKYGRLLVRARIPAASGSWPAIWTLGRWYEWPFCGEIDILEYYPSGGVPSIHANACWGSNTRWNGVWDSYVVAFDKIKGDDADWEKKFHIWRMNWDETAINLYLDDKLLNTIDLSNTRNGSPSDLPDGKGINPFTYLLHYTLLNLAIGSNGGTPDDSAFPLIYEIDYVRVYQQEGYGEYDLHN